MTQQQFLDLEYEINQRVIDKEQEIRGLILAVLSKKHVEYLGPPGGAKTMMIKLLSEAFDTSLFAWQLTEDTSVDEIMGPVSISSLKQDIYRRNTKGKLPEAEIASLDEIYKGNSRIRNGCLSIMQEHVYYNDGGEQSCPLITLIGSSNELPDDEGNMAFRDRMLLRFNTGYFNEVDKFAQMLDLRGVVRPDVQVIDRESLLEAQCAIKNMPLSSEAKDSVKLVWERLRQEGVVVSPRRYNQMLDVMAADSWLVEKDEICADSVLVGEHVLWTRVEDIRLVSQVIRSSVNPNLAKAQDILASATEAYNMLNDYTTNDELLQVLQQVRQMLNEVSAINTNDRTEDVRVKLDNMARQTLERMLSKVNAKV